MKRNLLALIMVPVLLTGCTKVLTQEDRLVGAWQLLYAEKDGFFKTTTINTGYENGTFYFYDNGQAEFDDGFTLMRGNWELRWVKDGYYDAYGQYQTGSHQVFRLQLVNFQENRVLDWVFDDSGFRSRNQFGASYQSSAFTYRFVFGRL